MQCALVAVGHPGYCTPCVTAQEGFFTPEDVIKYTPEWHGERFPDGRPKVPDDILDRMKNVTLEEAWATLRSAGFNHQYEDGWYLIHPDQVLVGRALTAMWMPGRPDVQKVIEEQGSQRSSQRSDERLACGHAAAARCLCGRPLRAKQDGPSIGDNVGNAIYAQIGKWHRLRWRRSRYQWPERTAELHVIRSLLRSFPPLRKPLERKAVNSTMVSINGPTRIGHVMAMPGDVVLGRNGGVLFIPPQLAEKVVKDSERTRLEDMFGHQRLKEKKYTAGQIDAEWTPEIEQDYHQWLKENEDHLPVPKSTIEEILSGKDSNSTE